MEVIEYAEAKILGCTRYFTGLVCRRGHLAERYLRGGCVECVRERNEIRQRTPGFRDRKNSRRRTSEFRRANIDRERAQRGAPMATRPCPDVCEICGRPQIAGGLLALDHDHVTGVFRGWLCNPCNTALGRFGDNKEGLLRAIKYLERSTQ